MLVIVIFLLVHSFYDQDCCANQHCHQVPCEEIMDTNWGWIWHPTGPYGEQLSIGFGKDALKISPDGNCHVCVYNLTNNTHILHGICIYLPPRV